MKAILAKHLVLENQILDNFGIIIADNQIHAIMPQDEMDINAVDVQFAESEYVLPGFIDIHIHGSAGADIMDASLDSIERIQRSIAKTGTTSFLATTMTVDFNQISAALDQVRSAMAAKEITGAKLLGAHLEGPFIHKKAKGAHLEQFILEPQIKLIESYHDIIKLVTLAPETDPEGVFIKAANRLGIQISLGHTTCSYDCARKAIKDGAKSVTHLFNAMTGLHHRDPGLVGAALLTDVYTELIADNIHVHPDLYELVYKLKGPERMILITDAMKGQCMKKGEYDLGGQKVIVGDEDARLENGTLAGSILTQDKSLRHMLKTNGLDLVKVSRMLSANPAQLLGLDDIGIIQKGAKADLVLLDANFELTGTMIEGVRI